MAVETIRRFTKGILVTINIIIGVLLIAGCYGYLLDPLYFWFTGLFSLAAFYLLLGLVIFAFFWLFVKPLMTLISCAFIIICWNPLNNLVQLRLTPNFTMAKHPANLRVMSWNVEHFDILEHKTHPERKEEMIDMIKEFTPDVACFQEMVGSDTVATAINYIPYFSRRLGMDHYHYSYNSKVDFDKDHHFGIITFSKYPIINKHTISYAPNDYNSIFQYIDIVREGDTFRIFNVHLQSLRFSRVNRSYLEKPSLSKESDIENSRSVISKLKSGFLKRKEQCERIREEIDKSPYPSIVCGDFNDVPNSYAYAMIGRDMHDAFTAKGTGIGRTFYTISPTLRIDYIFSGMDFSVEQYIRIKKKVSDHYPVVADLFYTGSGH